MKSLILAVIVFFTSWIWILGGTSSALPNDDLVSAAKSEGELSIYLSIPLPETTAILQLFKQKYPFIKVTYFRTQNDKLLNRILMEDRAGKFNADVVIISSLEVRVLIQKKLLQKYVSPESQYYNTGFINKEGYWTSLYSIPRVTMYNTKLVKPNEVPKTYEDLLKPRWKGNIAMTDSEILGFAGFLSFYGEEKGLEYMKKLAAQKPNFRTSPTIISQLVVAGEFPIGLVYSQLPEVLKTKGAPVDWVRTMEPIVTGMKPASLTSKALHPNAGKIFINFALSKECQELIGSFGRPSARSDSTLYRGIKFYPDDPAWGDNYSRYVKQFKDIFLKDKF